MDAATADTPLPRPESDHGTRYTDEERDHAYQLWAYRHDRDADRVASAMQPQCPGIEARTIRRWAVRYAWPERVRRDIQAIAPDIHAANVTALILGSAEAVQALREVARGDDRSPTAGNRVKAALGLLDRAGYPALAAAQPPALPDGGTVPSLPAATTWDDLLRRERAILSGDPDRPDASPSDPADPA